MRKINIPWALEMAQWIRGLVIKSDNLIAIFGIHLIEEES